MPFLVELTRVHNALHDLLVALPPKGAPATAPVTSAPQATGTARPRLGGLAARIAALDASFDPTARDDHVDTGTHRGALERATRTLAAAPLDPADVRQADDGTPFWGELDNESARARAAGRVLVIDQPECITCGTCVENTAAVFVLPDDGKAVAYAQDGPMDLIQDAIDACPVTCIHWVDDPTEFEQLNDAAGRPVA